jgi:NTP pyrophosphatase (non-canonical NTP hydrolase)
MAYPKKVNIKKLVKETEEWREKTFHSETSLSIAMKLQEEFFEVKEEIENSRHREIGARERLRSELADCFILLFGIAYREQIPYEDMLLAIQAKHTVNTLRTWNKPDANGIVKHKKL